MEGERWKLPGGNEVSKIASQMIKCIPCAVRVGKYQIRIRKAPLASSSFSLQYLLRGKVEQYRNALELATEIDLPQSLHYRYELLKEKAEKAKGELLTHSKRLSEATERVEGAKRKHEAGTLANIAADLHSMIRDMRNEYWMDDQRSAVEAVLREARSLAREYFPEWLPKQTIKQAVDRDHYKLQMETYARNFRSIGFANEQSSIMTQMNHVISRITSFERLKVIDHEIDVFLRSRSVSSKTCMAELLEWDKKGGKYLEILEQIRGQLALRGADVLDLRERISEFLEECQLHVRKHRQRLSTLENSTINELDDFAKILSEVNELSYIFTGQGNDYSLLQRFNRQITHAIAH